MEKKPVSKRGLMRAVHAQETQEIVYDENTLPLVATTTGGSISNLPVNTPYFNKWLSDWQSHNPFIGKHVEAAPEYCTKTKMIANDVLDANSEEYVNAMNALTDDGGEYDATGEAKFGLGEEDVIESDDPNDPVVKFMDQAILENTIKMLPGATDDDIIRIATQKIVESHNEGYETAINFTPIIEHVKTVMLIESDKKQEKRLKLLPNVDQTI